MKIKSQRDFWSGIVFVAVGVVFAWGATSYRFGSSDQPGPGWFPFGLGLLLALLGALILFGSLVIETEDGAPVGRWAWKPLAAIAGSVAVFGWALPRLGLLIALPLLVAIGSLAGSDWRWREVLIGCVVLTAASWLIFVVGLGLAIPLWPAFAGG